MSDLVPVRFRVHPLTKRKRLPRPRETWPDRSVAFQVRVGGDGAIEVGWLVEHVGPWSVREHLIYTGTKPGSALRSYVTANRARVVGGGDRRINLLSLEGVPDGLGYLLRDRCYRKGHSMVGADLAHALFAIAPRWSRSRTPGAWSLSFPGLSSRQEKADRSRDVDFFDAPRVIIEPFGERKLIRWGTTAIEHVSEDELWHRPLPGRGPFVDVLVAANALCGADDISDLGDACRRLGLEGLVQHGNYLDSLRAECWAIHGLYRAELAAVDGLGLGIDLGTLFSTAGVASALSRAAGLA